MRRGGIVFLSVNGELQEAKGEFTYDLGAPKRSPVVGADGVHGFSEEPKPAFIEGKITDRKTLDLAAMTRVEDATVTLELANGKTVVLRNAWYAADGVGNSKEGEIDFRFEAKQGEEVA